MRQGGTLDIDRGTEAYSELLAELEQYHQLWWYTIELISRLGTGGLRKGWKFMVSWW